MFPHTTSVEQENIRFFMFSQYIVGLWQGFHSIWLCVFFLAELPPLREILRLFHIVLKIQQNGVFMLVSYLSCPLDK